MGAALAYTAAAAAAPAADSTRQRLPASAAAGCGDSGVSGIGFTIYGCESGGGGTSYAHPAELLVVRTNGSYTSYPDAFSQPNLIARSPTGEVLATHNDSIVRVTTSALQTLVSERRLDRLFPASPGLAVINTLRIRSSGNVIFQANYYAAHHHGCGNVDAELTPTGQVRRLRRSATGLLCG